MSPQEMPAGPRLGSEVGVALGRRIQPFGPPQGDTPLTICYCLTFG